MSSPASLPLIAIVGRPNVGKSTLFNRLTGSRAALVSDLPGLTRDRREGTAKLLGNEFRLIDTAGLEEARQGSIADRMRKQTEQAIETADLVLFVIDARVGVTASDSAFAKIARQSGKPVVLVANKAEGRQGDEGILEAFSLGLGAPIAISAEHGEGIGDLAIDIMGALGISMPAPVKKRHRDDPETEQTPAVPAPESQRLIRVAIVGRPNAGKSTLVNALLGEDRMITGPEPGLTRDSVSSELTYKGRPILLFDTAGLRRKAKITETAEKLSASDAIRAIRFAEVVVLLVDAERPFEHQDLTIGHRVAEEGRALVVAVNKWDLVEEKQKTLRELRETVAESLAQVPNVPLVTISARSESGLDQLMSAIIKVHETWNRRISTPRLNRWLEEAMSRHAPPASHGRRIKIRYITQPSTRPPTFVAFCQRADALPQSYVKYLTNSMRDAFDLPGVPIRFSLRKGENPFAKG
ncbi:ribosome biogenesis GTPase Der [Hyphomicrobium methylovorum]|uniref:ribosome biogenesis GTPase Der n=1 Tax=Hyphomicrobium methylovorum TaxID=84 RepID=UPI0015E7026A|nr:ribosome biogenesis GTPase Der [Hyphomicrobium methylovorum]MBA2125360.1 ribosome biogenesis GTPase Der [Hyphomicrobium methylovorum]